MTPPGGSGKRASGGPPPRDGAGDDAGGEDGDADLAAMRSVWLSMRDEEPPGRGMAELLAAARTKAEAMAPKPRWWQRLAAALRRPPVLALATALVLLGGAVLLGGRLGEESETVLPAAAPGSARPRAPSESHAPAAAPAAMPGAPAGGLGDSKATGAVQLDGFGSADLRRHAAGGAAPAAPGFSEAGGIELGQGAAERGATDGARRGQAASGRARGADGAGAGAGGAAVAGDREADLVPPEAAPRPAARPGVDRDDAGAEGAEQREVPAAPVDAATGRATPPAAALVARRGSAADPRAPLYEQCEAAARRGDCAAVRRLVAQISQTDPGYRARVTQDAAFARCLE